MHHLLAFLYILYTHICICIHACTHAWINKHLIYPSAKQMVFFAFQTFIHFNIHICLLCPPLSLSSYSKGKSTFYLTYHMCVVCGLHNKINNNYNTNTNSEIIKLNSIARKCRRFFLNIFLAGSRSFPAAVSHIC